MALTPYVDNEGPDQTAHAQSDQGLHCPLTESMATVKCINQYRRLTDIYFILNFDIQ